MQLYCNKSACVGRGTKQHTRPRSSTGEPSRHGSRFFPVMQALWVLTFVADTLEF